MQIAVILCGGKGTRLFPLTREIPKPMLPIKGKSVLEYQIEFLRKNNVKTIYLAVGYLKEQIIDYFKDGSNFGVEIKYLYDNCEGTGGALRGLKTLLGLNTPILVMNGDTLFDVDIQDMVNHHSESITIAVANVENPDRYGVVQDGKIQEKIKVDRGLVSIGLYIIEPDVFSLIFDGYCSLEKDIFPLLKQGFYQYEGDWYDMGTMEVYEEVR
jgi:NDP-sugar pyrophosphorylase family protein